MTQKDHRARETARQSTRIMLLAIAAALPLGLYFAYRLSGVVLRPIQRLTESARELGEGNLDQVLPVSSRDELGQLADAFNKMAGKLRALPADDHRRTRPCPAGDGNRVRGAARSDHHLFRGRRDRLPEPRRRAPAQEARRHGDDAARRALGDEGHPGRRRLPARELRPIDLRARGRPGEVPAAARHRPAATAARARWSSSTT